MCQYSSDDMVPSQDVDPDLEAALEAIADAARHGRFVEIQDYIEQLPQHADRLRNFLASMRVLLDFGEEKSTHGSKIHPPADPTMAPPRTLGDFQILREIGRGGMGVVYEAEQLSLARRVALKVLPFAAILDERQLQRFKNEARAAAMLKHPNIVNVYSVGCERSVHFYAMELIEGPTLAEVSSSLQHDTSETTRSDLAAVAKDQETTPLAELSTQYQTHRKSFYRSIASLGVQAARALHYAHERDVIHRDIKPSNLLLDARGTLQIADFGLARIQSDEGLTLTGDVVGTLRYMSPQQVEGYTVDERTDIYSLGVTLYELLALRPAFLAQSRQALVRDVLERSPKSLVKIDPQIPHDLATIVEKCLSKDPNARYAEANQLADDLTRFLEHRPILAKPASRASHVLRWVRRRPALASLAGLTLCLLAFLAIAGPWLAIQQTELAAKLERQLYDASITNAFDALQKGDLGVASETLRRLSGSRGFETFQSFEYDFLASHLYEIDRATRLQWHTDVFSARPCPRDESLVAFGEWGGEVHLLNLRTRETRQIGQEHGHRNLVLALAFFHHHPLLVTTSLDGTIKIWDESSGKLIATEGPFENGIVSLAVAPDDSFLAVGFHETGPMKTGVRLFRITLDSESVSPLLEPLSDLAIPTGVHSLSFSSDSALLAAAAGDQQLRIWSTENGAKLESIRFEDRVGCVQFAPGKPSVLAVGTNLFETEPLSFSVHLVDAEHPLDKTVIMRGDDGLRKMMFAPDGSEIAVGTMDGQLIFKELSGQERCAIRGHSGFVESINYSANGTQILTGSRDGTVRLWRRNELPRSRLHLDAGEAGFVTDLCFSNDGHQLLGAYADGTARLWNLDRGTVVATFDGLCPQLFGVAISADAEWVATSGCEWGVGQGVLCIYNTRQPDTPIVLCQSNEPILDVEFVDHETVVAAVGKEIRRWDVVTRRELATLPGHEALVRRLVVSSSRSLLVSTTIVFGSHETEVRVWDLASGTCLQSIRDRGHMAIAISPNERLLAMGGPELLLYDRATGLERKLSGHSSEVLFVDFSPDGRRLVSTGRDGKTKVWNVKTGNCLLTFHHRDSVWSAKFSPDGNRLAIGHATPDSGSRIEVQGTDRPKSPSAPRR